MGDVLVGVFVIDAEGAMGMSPLGCLSLKLKMLWGCLCRGLWHDLVYVDSMEHFIDYG